MKILFSTAAVAALLSMGANGLAQGTGGDGQGMMGRMDHGAMGQGMMGHQAMHDAMSSATAARHRMVMRGTLPEAYRGLDNPLSMTGDDLDRGRDLFATHCASCHGDGGAGDGPAAEALEPKPVDLTAMRYHGRRAESLLFFAISEGGEPVDSPMPAFAQVLDADARWALVGYIRHEMATR